MVRKEKARNTNRTAGTSYSERNVQIRDINININYTGPDTTAPQEMGATVFAQIQRAVTLVEEESILREEAERDNGKMIEQLLPLFYNDRNQVARFLASVRGAQPRDVTSTVNELVKKNVISNLSCKGTLWRILHQNGLYSNGKRTWNMQVR